MCTCGVPMETFNWDWVTFETTKQALFSYNLFLRKKAIQVHAGHSFCSVVTADGQLITWGQGSMGQLGHGDESTSYVPRNVSFFRQKPVLSVSCSEMHTLVLRKNMLFSFGHADSGRLGLGDEGISKFSTPRPLPFFKKQKIISFSAGTAHNAVVTDKHEVYTWGKGEFGRLGTLSQQDAVTPVLVEALQGKNVVSITCGGDWTAVLTANGDVFTFGCALNGRLGVGAHFEDDKMFKPKIVELLQGHTITKIDCGQDHMAAITDEGELFTWGYGANGRLGLGDEIDQFEPKIVEGMKGKFVVDVDCGGYHTGAITKEGELFMWGWNHYGQLGHHDGSYSDITPSPIFVEWFQGKKVMSVACGEQHTIALVEPTA
eukprot:TRINITY_DN4850_c0_g1_i2.p1 TRINITY_DN4850_c0_g1~~TRINITY_DN4850_c0_g1_i2.p1  ORF type:complete len:374 (+),score=54.17 TRINITY_DN4850_c0_g1_i2:200-1321(+)